ncbi:MAG: elongation factor Ts [Chthonomonadales bacterium]|nr:elongation factor Ts [Chthonomonadales bacterium]
MEITAALVSQLREKTGVGMMECKKALLECDGDLEKAVDLLRVRGKAGAEKRAGRVAADGVAAAAIVGSVGAIVELNSETDFVARNDEFQALAQSVAMTAATNGEEDVSALRGASIPAGADYAGRTVGEALDEITARLRENIVLRRAAIFRAADGEFVADYVHKVTNKIAVLLRVRGDAGDEARVSAARSIAMHIAAAKPSFLRREDIPAETLEHERQILDEKARTENANKPEAIIERIVHGGLGKYYKQVCLLDQAYVRESDKTVGAALADAGIEVVDFRLFIVGQD